MTQILRVAAVLAVILIVTTHQTSALKCWNCKYTNLLGKEKGIKGCGYPFDANQVGSEHLQECVNSNPVCFTVNLGFGAKRTCANLDKMTCIPGPCQNVCKTDGCNGEN